jgi:Protein of unknown function (DUF2844)
MRGRTRWSYHAMSWILAITAPLCASASLGGNESSVQADQAHMRASLRTTPAANFTVHEIKSAKGVVVREYASSSGSVFAVAWEGPVLPDMKQVMGQYFDQYARAAQARRRHGPIIIHEPGLVVEMGGHQRSFSGRAYVPAMLPSGVATGAIQ